LSEQIDPYTAGLSFAVNLKDRSFVGSRALAGKSSGASGSGPSGVKRVGLKVEGRRAAREQSACYSTDGQAIGTVTSGTFSPTFNQPISMAYVNADAANVGHRIEVDIRGTRAPATVVELPFYKRS
jgi:aminomethyltransferase